MAKRRVYKSNSIDKKYFQLALLIMMLGSASAKGLAAETPRLSVSALAELEASIISDSSATSTTVPTQSNVE